MKQSKANDIQTREGRRWSDILRRPNSATEAVEMIFFLQTNEREPPPSGRVHRTAQHDPAAAVVTGNAFFKKGKALQSRLRVH